MTPLLSCSGVSGPAGFVGGDLVATAQRGPGRTILGRGRSGARRGGWRGWLRDGGAETGCASRRALLVELAEIMTADVFTVAPDSAVAEAAAAMAKGRFGSAVALQGQVLGRSSPSATSCGRRRRVAT